MLTPTDGGRGPTNKGRRTDKGCLRGTVGISPWSGYGVARALVDGWMKIPGHRANIINRQSRYMGVGVARSGSDVYATQNFGGWSAICRLCNLITQVVKHIQML